jgi:hypothetical protein
MNFEQIHISPNDGTANISSTRSKTFNNWTEHSLKITIAQQEPTQILTFLIILKSYRCNEMMNQTIGQN